MIGIKPVSKSRHVTLLKLYIDANPTRAHAGPATCIALIKFDIADTKEVFQMRPCACLLLSPITKQNICKMAAASGFHVEPGWHPLQHTFIYILCWQVVFNYTTIYSVEYDQTKSSVRIACLSEPSLYKYTIRNLRNLTSFLTVKMYN